MVREIPHHGNEQNVTAAGGSLDQETTFYRNEATLTTDFELTLPSDRGDYIFSKDPKDSITTDLSNIDSFLVGPIFHLPEELDREDEMKQLLEENDIVLLVTLIDGDTEHYLHFILN